MANFTNTPRLSDRYKEALYWAFEIHRMQVRKNGVPYISHVLAVSALVLEAGGDEAEAIAALLHDAAEDCGITISYIAHMQGELVAFLVECLSEPKDKPVEEQKQAYVDRMAKTGDAVRLISCADKLHNLRSYATDGRDLWKPTTAEFYRQLMPIYEGCDRVPRHWITEMRALLGTLPQ